MKKIIVLEHISMDGVIQGPGGVEEDTSGGFSQGGWIAPYSDGLLGEALRKQMNAQFDLLLGRKTFEIWAPYWPNHAEIWPAVNTATKYVASNTIAAHQWQPSVFLAGDISEKVLALKQQEGPNLHVWGSADLVQTLLRHDLIDVFWLMIYPITLGAGKRLFDDGTIPLEFTVTESQVTSKGVLIVNYERTSADHNR